MAPPPCTVHARDHHDLWIFSRSLSQVPTAPSPTTLPSAHCHLAYHSPKCPLPPRLPLLGVEDSLSSYWRNHGAFGKKIGGIASAWFQKELGSYNKRNSAGLAVSYFLSLFVKCMGMLPSALQALRGSYLSLCMLESMHTDPAECLSNV